MIDILLSGLAFVACAFVLIPVILRFWSHQIAAGWKQGLNESNEQKGEQDGK